MKSVVPVRNWQQLEFRISSSKSNISEESNTSVLKAHLFRHMLEALEQDTLCLGVGLDAYSECAWLVGEVMGVLLQLLLQSAWALKYCQWKHIWMLALRVRTIEYRSENPNSMEEMCCALSMFV